MPTSDEYLAKLGFDSSDMEGSVERLITLTGQLSGAFPELEKQLGKVERVLLSTTTATNKQAIADRQAAQAARERAAAMKQTETNLRALERRSQFVNEGLSTTLGRSDSGYRPTAFGRIANDASETKRAAQAQSSLTAEIRATEQARKSELAALRAAIQGRYADQAAAEAAEAAKTKAYEADIRGLSRLRYAIYDVSNSAIIGGAALAGMAAYGAKTAIDMQKEFAQVVRTTDATGSSVSRLRSEFKDLYTSLPTSYDALTQVGSLGGQLNIPINRLKEFTKVTTEFSATSDVALESAGTAFGRLDKLLPDVQGNYEGLADSILKVGVNSVATESQIISITSQIAPLANIAKLSSKETIGLAGALASLGVAPENARGNVTRLFGLIDSAVAQGGSRLSDFAKLSGRTSEQFTRDWTTAGNSQQLLFDLFKGINAQGQSTTAVLADIGINATRDQVTFSKLAQNVGVYENAVQNATDAGGELGKQYSVISSTVSAKLQVLSNNFQQLVSTVSNSAGGIGLLIDPIILLLQYLDRLASNPAGATIATFGLSLAALAGTALIVTGALGRLVANYYAGVTAANELTGSTSLLGAAKKIATGQVNLFAIGLDREAQAARGATTAQEGLAAATGAVSAATGAATAAAGANAAANAVTTTSMKQGVGWAGKLSGILGKAGIAGAIVSLLPLVFDLGNGIADWATDGTQAAAGLNKTTADYLDLLKNGGAQDAIANLASNAKELASVGDEGFGRFLRDITFSAGGLRAVEEQLTALDSAIAELAQTNAPEAQRQLNYVTQQLGDAGFTSEQFAHYFSQSTQALADGTLAAEQQTRAQEDLTQAINETISANTDYISSFLGVQRSLRALGEGIGKDGLDFSGISEAGISNLDNLLKVVDAVAAQTPGDAATIIANLRSLYDTLQRAGVPAEALQFLQNTISQLLAGSGGQVGQATIRFDSFFGGISSGAADAAKKTEQARKEIRTLVDYANDLGGVLDRAFSIRFGPTQGADTVTSAWNRIRSGIEDAKKQIVDYKDGIADANQELANLDARMKDYQATLQQLAADRAVNQYWLNVANRFGNTLRATQIGADLAKNDAEAAGVRNDMVKAQQDRETALKRITDLNIQVADAQAKANFTLTGNTDAAIANRAALFSLIGDYNSYLKALADSGVSSEDLSRIAGQLRDDFGRQAEQAGISRDQIDLYSASFDDMAKAIGGVPRDITVDSNIDPAMQALNEFLARYYQDKNNIESTPINVPLTVPVPDIAGAIKTAVNDAKNSIGSGPALPSGKKNLGFFDSIIESVWRPFVGPDAKLPQFGFATGTTWTGSGPANKVAGVVHNREAVLNQRATRMVPPQWINSWNQGRQPVMPTVTVQAAPSSNEGVVDLGSKTMRQMTEIMAMMRTIIGDDQIAGIVDRAHASTRSVGG